jgi:hypothetical protein
MSFLAVRGVGKGDVDRIQVNAIAKLGGVYRVA